MARFPHVSLSTTNQQLRCHILSDPTTAVAAGFHPPLVVKEDEDGHSDKHLAVILQPDFDGAKTAKQHTVSGMLAIADRDERGDRTPRNLHTQPASARALALTTELSFMLIRVCTSII